MSIEFWNDFICIPCNRNPISFTVSDESFLFQSFSTLWSLLQSGNSYFTLLKIDDLFPNHCWNLKSYNIFWKPVKFCIKNVLRHKIWWKDNRVYKEFKKNACTFLPLAENKNWNWLFSTFLVLLDIDFIFDQFMKAIPVLKSSEPKLSDGSIHFPFTLSFRLG